MQGSILLLPIMTLSNNYAVLIRFCRSLLLALILVPPALAAEVPPSVAEATLRAGIPTNAIGIHVQEVGGNAPLLVMNASSAFNPASTMKLVTTHAALEMLGPAYTWKTRVFALGPQIGDVLQGDLAMQGGGDPKLTLERLWMLLRELRARGIRDIRGNLVLDRNVFEPQPFNAAIFDDDPLKPYNAGPDALLLDHRTLRLRLLPDEANGRLGVMADPPMAPYTIQPPRLTNGPCGDWRGGLLPSFDESGIRFDGAFAASCGERTLYLHAGEINANRYAGAVFRRIWEDLGGTFQGQAVDGVVPAGARLITAIESPPLPEIVRDINKFSNNVMARQLLLTLAAEITALQGNPERGAVVVKTWLAAKGIAAPELVIENGAGLSRVERISADTLGRMLVAAFRAPIMPEFIASMPLVGIDGTMRNRLKERSVVGNAHIKTGSLNEVRAIAGYVLAASGKRYAVVCLINHPNAKYGRDVQDALLQWVYEAG